MEAASSGRRTLIATVPVVPAVARQVHRGHAALADQPLDGIAPVERGAKLLEQIGH